MTIQTNQEIDLEQRITLLHNQAVDHHKKGELANAVKLYQEAIKLDNDQPAWVYGNLLTLLTELKAVDQAVALGVQIKADYNDSDDFLRAFALALEEQGNLSSSIIYYQQAINLNPSQPNWVYSRLANILIDQNSLEQAIQIGQQGITIHPNSYWINYYLGIAFEKNNDLEQANIFQGYAQQIKSGQPIKAVNTPVKITPLPSDGETRANSEVSLVSQDQELSNQSQTQVNMPLTTDLENSSQQASLTQLDIESKKNIIYHQVDNVMNHEPEIHNSAKLSTKNLSFMTDDIVELSEPQIENQIKLIKARLQENYQEQLFEGLLYELAKTQLLVKSFNYQLKIFSNKLIMKDCLLPGFSVSNQDQSIEIDAEFPLSSSQGFYVLEYNNQGTCFRWTGPENVFYFDLFLNRAQQSELTLILCNAIVPEIVSNLRCFIDGNEISLRSSQEDKLFYLKGTIPPGVTNEMTRVSFLMPQTTQASDVHPDSQDDRLLGVAFHKITIRNV